MPQHYLEQSRGFSGTSTTRTLAMPACQLIALLGALAVWSACSEKETLPVHSDGAQGGSGGAAGSMSDAGGAGGSPGGGGSIGSDGSTASGGTNATGGGAAFGGSSGSSASDSGGTGGSDDTSTAAGGTAGAAPFDDAPVPGEGGETTIEEQSFTSVTISWMPASDDLTPVSDLEYRVYHSLQGDLDTLERIDDNGLALNEYTAGIASATLEIQGGVDNYLVVVVRDEAENRAAYEMLEIPFAEAETCQVPGDCFSGNCRISYRDRDGDNYGVTTDSTGRCDGSIPAGYAAQPGDCCDDGGNLGLAADIHPGQTEYFTSAANICDIEWDYDCSEEVEVEHATRLGACEDEAEAPECPQEVITITEADCGVRFYGCGCAVSGGSCVGVCAGQGVLMGCH